MNATMINWIVSSSLLMVVVLVLRWLFGEKISRRMRYALWLVVLVRLLVPVSLGNSRISVQNWIRWDGLASNTEAADTTVSDIAVPTGDMPNIAMPNITISDIIVPGVDQTGPNQPRTEKLPVSAAESSWNMQGYLSAALQIWKLGAVVALGWILGVNLVFYRKLRHSRRQIREHKGLAVYVTSEIVSPCLFGFFSAAIYLTPQVAGEAEGMFYAILHEERHHAHGDHVWSFFRGVCLAVWWWNPLVWWAASMSRQDCELACDEACVHILGQEHRQEYGQALIDSLRATAAGSMRQYPGMAATLFSGKKELKTRLQVLGRVPLVRWSTVAMLVMTMTMSVVVTFAGKAADGNGDSSDSFGGNTLDRTGALTYYANGEINIYVDEFPSTHMFLISNPEQETGLEEVYVIPNFAENCIYYVNDSQHALEYRRVSEEEMYRAISVMSENQFTVCLRLRYEDGQITAAYLRSEQQVRCNEEQPLEWKQYTWMYEGSGLENYTLVQRVEADVAETKGLEEILIYTAAIQEKDHGLIMIKDQTDKLLFAREYEVEKTSNESYFLTEHEGQTYLMTVSAHDAGGGGAFEYRVFRLDAKGNTLQKRGAVYAWFFEERLGDHIYDSEQFFLWAQPMYEYLQGGKLLLDTCSDEVRCDVPGAAETYAPQRLDAQMRKAQEEYAVAQIRVDADIERQ